MSTIYVDCPICGGSDMPKKLDPESDNQEGYIHCSNLNCGSNGGDNFEALSEKLKKTLTIPESIREDLDNIDFQAIKNVASFLQKI